MGGNKGIYNNNTLEAEDCRSGGLLLSCKGWVMRVWEFARDEPNRVIFSLKVGLAILLVSLLILIRAPYEIFGTNIIWSIITVAIMFEYTVGSTFNKGFNRALGSLLAGVLAIVAAQLGLLASRVFEPIIIGISIFLVGTATSFVKLWPSLAPYEYGFRVMLFTYCLIIVSAYRMGNPIRTAMDRLYSIAIGGLVAVLVNVMVCPIWDGELLHEELVKGFDSVADSLEECVKKYVEDDGLDHPEFSKTVMDEFPDEPAYRRCRSTLNSSEKLDSLAQSAKWEPPHGRFKHFFYPWSEYAKVGNVLRYCAYEVMALHGVLHSEIQAPYNLRAMFRAEMQEAAGQAAELVRRLGMDIRDMNKTLKSSLLKRVHDTSERLQATIDMHSFLLVSSYEKPPAAPMPDGDTDTNPSPPGETYHEMMRKTSRRFYTWPSREVDAYEEEAAGVSAVGSLLVPRMKALESTSALSLVTFTSLLIEFVARLDHLVDAVEELSSMAKFKSEVEL
ncbi:hypothetical protein SAY87_031958 [Trapa incisa]|uniref:Aluminum-activated malate transporter 9 n=1 Tax=Trapa incisa TaxID=236973 RepID=A0AAN7KY62_9MYRT|nr:hypothetical protein SAY87_031958 [Trapa incisa]